MILKTYYNGEVLLPIGDLLELVYNGIKVKISFSLTELDFNTAKDLPAILVSNEKSYAHDILYAIYEYVKFISRYALTFKDDIYVLYGLDMDNAYWNGFYFCFGHKLTSLAIVGHELTHALIQSMCNLRYVGHSGALNESFADIFGVMLERHVQGIGFDLGSECGIKLRNMRIPHELGQPERMYDSYYMDPSSCHDNGYVHINSGIPSHVFVIVSDKIGIYNAFSLFLDVLRRLQPTSNFRDFKRVMLLVNSEKKYINNLHQILDWHIN